MTLRRSLALGWLATIDKIAAVTERVLAWTAAILMAALLTIVGLQVVDRHFVDVPITSPDAYARICVVWLTFLGYALATRSGLAIRVDLVDHWLSPRMRDVVAGAFDLVILATLVLLLTKGWLIVKLGADQSILGTDLTTAVPNAALMVGFVALFLFLLARSIRRFVPGR